MKHLLLLTTAMLISMGCHAETITGKCYEGGVNWLYDTETGTLTFTPDEIEYWQSAFIPAYYYLAKGEAREILMTTNGDCSERPDHLPEWYDFKDDIKCVVIADNIRNIGRCAFKLCSNLESVHLPAYLHSIASAAFYGCGNLEEVHTRTLSIDSPDVYIEPKYQDDTNLSFYGIDLSQVKLMVAKDMKTRLSGEAFYSKFGSIVEEDVDAIGTKEDVLKYHPSFEWNKNVPAKCFEMPILVIPTTVAYRNFCTRHSINAESLVAKSAISYGWTLFLKGIDAGRLVQDEDCRYDCMDGEMYLVNEIPEDFWEYYTSQPIEIDLANPNNDSNKGNGLFTRNIIENSLQYITCDSRWNVPDNKYIIVAPKNEGLNPSVGYDIGILLPGIKHEVTVVMAPNTEDVEDQRPNYIRIFTYNTQNTDEACCEWDLNSKNQILVPESGEKQFTTDPNACYKAVFTVEPKELVQRYLILIESNVSSKSVDRYDRTLRIASITVKHVYDSNETGIDCDCELRNPNDGVMYNLSGQMVSNDYKGIVIINGKKVLK